ncbi:MAG: DUF349 domain-containing protein [Acidiferrobacterales bacterium]|nr:DUF349 domain-containing protein [Acidiferrobacterales bacterium]
MEPEELIGETDVSQTITTEYAAKSLLADLKTVLSNPKEIDEQKAKQLRKAWDALQSQVSDTTVDISELEAGFEKLRVRTHKQVEHRNEAYAELEKLLTTLAEAIKKDELQDAQQTEQKIISGLNKIRGLSSQRRQKVIGTLEALQPKIKKLSSWRHWGTEQAREKIIQEVQQIHEKEKNLEKVAQFIKQAREEWKQWDNSGEGGNKTLYKQFDAACSKAYEPCKALFDQQRKQREAASRHKKEVCEKLENEYEKTDWRNPDWKQLQTLMREQSSRWRKLGPAEFRDRKPLQKRFDDAAKRIDGPLDRERKRNKKQREDLIAQILGLVEMEDSRKAISDLQVLKKQWVVTVSGPRKKEQILWNKFTKACDAIYEKSRESKKAFDQELEKNFEKRMVFCDAVESELKNPEIQTVETVSKLITKWKNEWTDTGRVPKSKIKASDKRWREVLGNAEKMLSGLQRKNQTQSDESLFAFAEVCAQLEAQLLGGQEVQIDAAQAEWQKILPLADGVMKKMQNRFDKITKAIGNDTEINRITAECEKNFEKLNSYLLQLELNLSVDSPAEFTKQRMALQVNRLSAALGKGGEDVILDNQKLVDMIHTLGPVTPDKQTAINTRFATSYKALQAEVS